MYFPKSKILENLYTSGNEFLIKSSNQPYQGYYHNISNNKFFSGKTLGTINSEELIKINLKNEDFKLPNPYFPNPTLKDFEIGYINRCFVKKRNEDYNTIREISENDYNLFVNSFSKKPEFALYVCLKLKWRIGKNNQDDIINTNKQLVKYNENIIPRFSLYFKDFSQFSGPFNK